jgi:glutathione S-transferase
MDGAGEFTEWSGPEFQPKTRRSLPPDLVHAVDLERLYWTLHIKGLATDYITLITRSRRLGVRFAHTPGITALGINAALREIERQAPQPALIPHDIYMRKRAAALEKWAVTAVAPAVLWTLLQPINAARTDAAMTAPIARALNLIAGLTRRHAYLMGEQLSAADITLAAALAPIARKDGWTWAGRLWTPLALLAGRTSLASHAGAAWVRGIYAVHGKIGSAPPDAARAWIP